MTRRARPDEASALAAMLARAFEDDPVMAWAFPHATSRLAWYRRFYRQRLRALLPGGEVYTAAGLAGAALWAEPEQWRPSLRETLALALLVPGTGRATGRVLRGLAQIEARHPETPHWYLSILGTEPSRRGEGIGSRLLEPVLEGCDADELPAYLESSKERNLAFYARHGFRVTGELRLPGGPPVWFMWRDPRP